MTLHLRRPDWLVALLILTLLGPGLLPVQGHTRLSISAHGQLQTICTWQSKEQQDSPEPWQSPAYVYAQLMVGAAFGSPGVLVTTGMLPARFEAVPFLRREGLQPARRYRIRAPPPVLS